MDAVKLKLKPKFAAPPDHLSEGSKTLWNALVSDYGLTGDDAALMILKTALESRDRADQAQTILNKEGLTVEDRTRGLKAHPLVAVERNARAACLQAMKMLHFDIEPARPGRSTGRR